MSETERALEEERRIINAATAGPWKSDSLNERVHEFDVWAGGIGQIGHAWEKEDAEFIAHARTALPLRSAQVAAVLAECAEMHSSARLLDALGVDPDKAKALRAHADLIRRAIEEAGA